MTPVVKAARDAGSFDAAWQAPLDKSLERRLRAGDVAIGARLDLHGMTQREAHCALEDFLERQVAAGKRVLLVITGKGRMGGGVLRARLAGWLAASPCATHIRGVRSAAPKHGGAGAFYVLLGKRKDER
ncbi:MAG TPA: Smr/MutS family protein [Alphaproteobacteria bacterium]|nr:Smr/MutS family protein [Alphaproteobacteria bacterium]